MNKNRTYSGAKLHESFLPADTADASALLTPEIFENAIDHSPIGLVFVDIEGKFIRVNNAFCNQIGYSKDELLNRSFLEITYEPDKAKSIASLQDHLKKKLNTVTIEKRYVHKNGQIKQFRISSVLLNDRDGKPGLFFVQVVDITSEVESRQALEESEKRFRELADLLPQTVFEVNREGRLLYSNKFGLQLTGYTAEEIEAGINVFDLFPEEEKRNLFRNIEILYKHGTIDGKEYTIIHKNGTKIPVVIYANVIYRGGEIAGIRGVMVDRREQYKTEMALRKSEEQYRAIFDHVPIGILHYDITGTITQCNDEFVRIIGSSRDKLIGMEMLTRLKNKKVVKAVKDSLQKGTGQFNGNYMSVTANKVTPVRSRFNGIRDNKGRIIGGVGIIEDETERLESDKQLQQAAQELSKLATEQTFILDNMLDFVYRHDTDGIFYYLSPAVEKITGYSVKDWKKHYSTYLTDNPINEKVYEFTEKTLKTGVVNPPYRVEVYHKNGSRIMLEVSEKPYFENGKVAGIVGVARDITDRIKAEEALKASEARFKHLFEKMPDAIFLTRYGEGEVGQIIEVNPAAELQTGYSREELLSMNILRDLVVHPDNEELIKKREKEFLTNKLVHFHEQKRRKDGSLYWTAVQIAQYDIGGETFAISVNHDITQQIEAEKEIRKLSLAIQQSPVSVLIADVDGKIDYANPRFTKRFGIAAKDVIGRPFGDVLIPYIGEQECRKMMAAVNKGREWSGDYEVDLQSFGKVWKSISVSPIKEKRKNITHYLIQLEDISERVKLRNQLAQASKMESIGTLAGGIAHDFNNLLTVINGHTEIALLKLNVDHPVRADLQSILTVGNRAEDLTRQLLAFSRKQMIQPRILNLNEVMVGLNKMLGRLIGEDITIEMNLAGTLPPIKADPGQLEQILMNLIVNARDAIKEKGGRAKTKKIIVNTGSREIDDKFVGRHTEFTTGSKVYFSVKDTGKGIPAEIRNKIFDPFFTTKETGKGTGLGLSTVYGIVKQNNANILVESKVGTGTTISIFWPVASEEPADSLHRKKTEIHSGSGATILLVEDDEGVRKFAENAIRQFGYEVAAATNGKNALEMVREQIKKRQKHTFDLLITDVVMPEMNGRELSEKIREILPDIKILFTSGYYENFSGEKDLVSDSTFFMQKPYTIQTLSQKIANILQDK